MNCEPGVVLMVDVETQVGVLGFRKTLWRRTHVITSVALPEAVVRTLGKVFKVLEAARPLQQPVALLGPARRGVDRYADTLLLGQGERLKGFEHAVLIDGVDSDGHNRVPFGGGVIDLI
jgi:hypothetical protein